MVYRILIPLSINSKVVEYLYIKGIRQHKTQSSIADTKPWKASNYSINNAKSSTISLYQSDDHPFASFFWRLLSSTSLPWSLSSSETTTLSYACITQIVRQPLLLVYMVLILLLITSTSFYVNHQPHRLIDFMIILSLII